MHVGRVDPKRLPDIDEVILPAYLQGLRQEGHEATPDQARFGCVGSRFARSGFSSLPFDRLGPTRHPPTDRTCAPMSTSGKRLIRAILDLANRDRIAPN